MFSKNGFYILIFAACALLSACGGNGGGSSAAIVQPPAPSPAPSPSPDPQENFETAEYNAQPGLADINVIPAYQAGAFGQDVVVSIIDTGIAVDNAEFAGRIHPDSADLIIDSVVGPGNGRAGGPSLQDEDDHGTPIASIIGAARDDAAVHGVAPEAELLVYRVDDESANESFLVGSAIIEAVERSATLNAGVINMSFGSNDASARSDFASLFEFTKTNDMVVVIAAGNTDPGLAEPDQSARGAVDVAGDPTTIVAGAYDARTDQIASFSNRAGETQDIYLLAPGVLIPTVGANTPPGQTESFSGTSAATPHIVGAAALLRSLWPQLSASEVVDILLTSATDLGAPGPDPVYGQGLLNVGAAVSPIGGVSVSGVDGTSSSVSELQAQLSGPFGASLSSLGDIVVFDVYDRNFTADLGAGVTHEGPARFDLEETLNPFERHMHASRRLSEHMSAQMRLTSEDHSLTDFSAHQAASFTGLEARGDLIEDRLAMSLTSDLGAGRTLSVAQGFSPTAMDSRSLPIRRTPFMTRSAFVDAYLPQAEGAFTASMTTQLGPRLIADFLAAHAYDFYAQGDALLDAPEPHEDRRSSVFRTGLTMRTGAALLRIEQGVLQEAGAVLGAAFEGGANASTFYGAVEADWTFAKAWRLKGRYALGRTSADISGFGGLIDDISALTTSHFSVSLSRARLFGAADSLWLGVSQPLRVDAGSASLTLPTEYNPLTDQIIYTTTRASLAQEGRQYDLEAGYRLFMGPLGALDVNLIHQLYADEAQSAATTLVLRSGFSF